MDKSDWSVVQGTPSLPNTGYGVYADNQYVYLAHQSGNYFTVVGKGEPDGSGWSVVLDTPSLPGDGYGVFADGQTLYVGHIGAPYLTAVSLPPPPPPPAWSIVEGTLATMVEGLPGQVNGQQRSSIVVGVDLFNNL